MKPGVLLVLIALSVFTSCTYIGGKRIKGDGVASTQQRDLGSFSGVSAMGSMDVIVTTGDTYSIKIEADQNLMEYIETRKNGNTIEIYTREGYNLDPESGIKIYATAPLFDKLIVSGSGKIKSEGKILSNSELRTEVSGSGDIIIEVDAPKVAASISGSGSANLKGTTKDLSVHISGSGDLHCYELLSENAAIEIAGSANAEVYASKTLDVAISGAGDLRYKGNPSITKNISGSGDIRKID